MKRNVYLETVYFDFRVKITGLKLQYISFK